MHFPLISAIPKRISPNFPECKMLWKIIYSLFIHGVHGSLCQSVSPHYSENPHHGNDLGDGQGSCSWRMCLCKRQCLIHLKISDLWILINEGAPNHPFKWRFTSCLPSILRYPRYLHLWKPPLIPSGYLTLRHGKSQFLIGKPSQTIYFYGSFPMANC